MTQATFTATVAVASLSLFNDLLSKMGFDLYLEEDHLGIIYYTPYSIGMIFGTISVQLNVGIAMIASVMAVLAQRPNLKRNWVLSTTFLSIMQISGIVLTGVSLVLLTFTFHGLAGILATLIHLSATLISLFQLKDSVKWKRMLNYYGIGLLSFLHSVIVLIISIITFNNDSWMIIPLFTLTFCYHIVVSNASRPCKSHRTRLQTALYFACPVILSGGWASAAIAIYFWKPSIWRVKASLSGFQSLVMLVVGIFQGTIDKDNECAGCNSSRH